MAIAACPQMTDSQVSNPFSRLAAQFATWRRRARERADLALIEERDLRELGLSRAVLEFELNKPFWRDLKPQGVQSRSSELPAWGDTQGLPLRK